jgi:hypothetical protein
MNQHPIPNIVGMEILNLKVVDGNRCFEQLMLYLFDNNARSVNCLSAVSPVSELLCRNKPPPTVK